MLPFKHKSIHEMVKKILNFYKLQYQLFWYNLSMDFKSDRHIFFNYSYNPTSVDNARGGPETIA